MQVAVLTFQAFNELDSFVAAALLNRLSARGVQAWIVSPTQRVVSKNGIAIDRQKPLAFANIADAVIIGSGMASEVVAADPHILATLHLDPARQLIASQCSGALLLAALGLVSPGEPVCTDHMTAPGLAAHGFRVLERPFHAAGNVASAGGCLSATYLAAWIAARGLGPESAREMIHGAAPVGEKEAWVERTLAVIAPFLAPVAA
ncbi:DJ-1/PfpI family protein [Phenylobacterium sp.]|uniref:DJ-1/PfpI family protein n=1 Tax=Phenylobacterium sp. TaxID=1871053 RepID=UPI0027169FD1|nr:DJ-1/PfpI family protein [Phenylobacterium sp.]MDO8380500.1 DJ-1/PfpI family protein [Phenylobacterium sp.]